MIFLNDEELTTLTGKTQKKARIKALQKTVIRAIVSRVQLPVSPPNPWLSAFYSSINNPTV